MKRQTIYTMLIVALAAVLATHAQAQTRESDVSEARLLRLQAPDESKNIALKFGPSAVSKVQMRSVDSWATVSPNTTQELRALIFKDEKPAGSGGTALRATATPQIQRSQAVGKLPSELSAEEGAENLEAISPAQTPPTQGNAEEAQ